MPQDYNFSEFLPALVYGPENLGLRIDLLGLAG